MTGTEQRPHAWYTRRLEALRVGLLPEDEHRALRAHVADCADCADALRDDASASSPGRGEHVPAAVLARWPASAGQVTPLERELVEHHLARCAECRDALAIAASVRVRAVPARTPVARVPRPWAVGAWAGGAAAAVALTWGALRPGVGARPAPSPPVPIAIAVAGEGTRLRDVTRGAGAPATPALDLAAREPVALIVDPPDVPDDATVTLELARDDGPVLARSERPQRELYPNRRILIGADPAPLPAGRYVLRLVAHAAGAPPDTQQYAFTLRRH